MKSTIKLRHLAFIFAILPLLGSAQENKPLPATFSGHGENSKRFIESHDLDADGVLTWQEFEQFRRQRFAASDKNDDGGIDLAEYIAEFEARIGEMLKGELGEIDTMTARRFDALAGSDGHIARADFDHSGERMYAMFEKGGQNDGNQPTRRRLLDLPTSHTRNGMLAMYDRNSDGQLPREEFDLMREEQFKRTDANRDGRLSRDEYIAEFQQRIDKAIHELKTRELRQTRVRFGVLDTNRDDRIDWDEYIASGKRLFEGNDRNSDGRIDAADIALPAPKRGQ